MSDSTEAVKDASKESAVPLAWRPTLCMIADSFCMDCGEPSSFPSRVRSVDPETFSRARGNIAAYGARLGKLPPSTWDTSVYIWTEHGGHWKVMVDLFDADGGITDLVLFCRVHPTALGPEFELVDVHTP